MYHFYELSPLLYYNQQQKNDHALKQVSETKAAAGTQKERVN